MAMQWISVSKKLWNSQILILWCDLLLGSLLKKIRLEYISYMIQNHLWRMIKNFQCAPSCDALCPIIFCHSAWNPCVIAWILSDVVVSDCQLGTLILLPRFCCCSCQCAGRTSMVLVWKHSYFVSFLIEQG